MLHMLVNTHSEDSCAFRSEENREALVAAFPGLSTAAAAHGGEVAGTWVNMASHTVFVLIDAPNAHAVDEIVRDSGLIGYTTTTVYAVETMETAIEAVSE